MSATNQANPTNPAETAGYEDERYRLAAVMRMAIEQLARVEGPDQALRRAAGELEDLAAELARFPRRSGTEGYAESANAGDIHALFDRSPLIGLANPLAPPIRLRTEGDRVFGDVRFGSAYEGPPGCLHGGFVAAAFDEVLGFAQSLTGNPGMTGTLTIRYKAPTPLHTDLRFEAWVEKVDGRKIFARGTLSAGRLVTAEAEGLFISIDAGRFASLIQEAGRRMRQGDEA